MRAGRNGTEKLIDNLQKWLRRNKSNDTGKGQGEEEGERKRRLIKPQERSQALLAFFARNLTGAMYAILSIV
jgi:hypothetical protein